MPSKIVFGSTFLILLVAFLGKPSRCTNYWWGCEMGGLCQLA